nr:MAG TPA: hypothetical protein [Caudoviricetes sp.]
MKAYESLTKDLLRDVTNISKIVEHIDSSKIDEALVLLSKLNQEVKLTYTKLHSLHNRR